MRGRPKYQPHIHLPHALRSSKAYSGCWIDFVLVLGLVNFTKFSRAPHFEPSCRLFSSRDFFLVHSHIDTIQHCDNSEVRKTEQNLKSGRVSKHRIHKRILRLIPACKQLIVVLRLIGESDSTAHQITPNILLPHLAGWPRI